VRRTLLWIVVCVVAMVGAAFAQDAAAPTHVMSAPKDLKWGDPPPVFEKGAKFTVVSGDPSKEGLYVVRLQMPAGYKINPHWHPTDEHVTVISGTFALGMGEKFDKAAMKELPAGGYALLPAEMRHYAMAKTAATVQVHGMGPFQLTYVNPADDPSKRTTSN
jgi:quercetin dioxygenase-like cupin family protein